MTAQKKPAHIRIFPMLASLPYWRFPDIRRNEKSHSSMISLRKVALNKRNLYFSFLPLGTDFCRFPYYSVLSGIIGKKFAVLFSIKGLKALILLHSVLQRLHSRDGLDEHIHQSPSSYVLQRGYHTCLSLSLTSASVKRCECVVTRVSPRIFRM